MRIVRIRRRKGADRVELAHLLSGKLPADRAEIFSQLRFVSRADQNGRDCRTLQPPVERDLRNRLPRCVDNFVQRVDFGTETQRDFGRDRHFIAPAPDGCARGWIPMHRPSTRRQCRRSSSRPPGICPAGVCEDLRAGRLEQVLASYQLPESGIYAVMPERRLVLPRVRAFVEFITQQLGETPPWERHSEMKPSVRRSD